MAKRTCSIDGCPKPAWARGWCNMHYYRWHRYGDPNRVQLIYGDDIARFWSKVDKHPDGCWGWGGSLSHNGYGRFFVRQRSHPAHRWSYEHFVGPIPDGFQVDHLCRNPPCVNPAHLEAVTPRENVLRSPTAPSAVNSRKTHCKHGHPFDDQNTYWYEGKKGLERKCRECARATWHRYEARRKAARDLTATGAT